jgi:hypothetical protein
VDPGASTSGQGAAWGSSTYRSGVADDVLPDRGKLYPQICGEEGGPHPMQDPMQAFDVEIGDHVTVRGEEWEVTDAIDRRKGEEIELELTRWTVDNKEIKERVLFDADDEIEIDRW